jgi:hypothetical protein
VNSQHVIFRLNSQPAAAQLSLNSHAVRTSLFPVSTQNQSVTGFGDESAASILSEASRQAKAQQCSVNESDTSDEDEAEILSLPAPTKRTQVCTHTCGCYNQTTRKWADGPAEVDLGNYNRHHSAPNSHPMHTGSGCKGPIARNARVMIHIDDQAIRRAIPSTSNFMYCQYTGDCASRTEHIDKKLITSPDIEDDDQSSFISSDDDCDEEYVEPMSQNICPTTIQPETMVATKPTTPPAVVSKPAPPPADISPWLPWKMLPPPTITPPATRPGLPYPQHSWMPWTIPPPHYAYQPYAPHWYPPPPPMYHPLVYPQPPPMYHPLVYPQPPAKPVLCTETCVLCTQASSSTAFTGCGHVCCCKK